MFRCLEDYCSILSVQETTEFGRFTLFQRRFLSNDISLIYLVRDVILTQIIRKSAFFVYKTTEFSRVVDWLLLLYSISSGALGSPDLLLSCSLIIITIAHHNHHTNYNQSFNPNSIKINWSTDALINWCRYYIMCRLYSRKECWYSWRYV